MGNRIFKIDHRLWYARYYTAQNEKQIQLLEKLESLLPHGSGIDGNWNLEYLNKNIIHASNYFHAMDESGMYCHSYDFTARYKYNGIDKHLKCEYCHGSGIRYVKDFMQFYPTMTESQLIDWFTHDNRICAVITQNEFGYKFDCNICHGKGYTIKPEFEYLSLNFHGNKEYSCCGYGLKDYLSESLHI